MTQEIDKDNNIRALDRRLDKIEAVLPDLLPHLEALFGPPPAPRAPMLAIMRAFASDAGCAEQCASPRCRRAKACCARSSATETPPCADQWDGVFAGRLEAAFLGVMAAWADEKRRMERLYELVDRFRRRDQGRWQEIARQMSCIRPNARGRPGANRVRAKSRRSRACDCKPRDVSRALAEASERSERYGRERNHGEAELAGGHAVGAPEFLVTGRGSMQE